MRRYLAHHPSMFESADALFWYEDGEWKRLIQHGASERSILHATATLLKYESNPNGVSPDDFIDWLSEQRPSPEEWALVVSEDLPTEVLLSIQ